MLITRKRKRNREDINIFLNNKRLEQVKEMKYLGIYYDNRLNFHKHTEHIAEKSRKMIYMLGKTAKLNWGLGHKSLKTIYKGALVPLMTYGAPVWEEAVKKQRLLRKMQSTQRLIGIKTAKAFRTLSYEASCVLDGVHPIRLAIEEKVQTYKATHNNIEYDAPLEVRYWPHPAEIPLIREPTEIPYNVITIFTDGSKTGGKVGAAAVIIKDDKIIHQYKFRLHERCSNNQAEQVAVLKALEQIQSLQVKEDEEKIAVVNTDSKVTLDTLKNRNKHSILIENIKKEIKRLEDLEWTVFF
jgi:hypothetical protein